MLIDSHVHVGQFCEMYTTPREIVEIMDDMGVDKFALSSTTMCEEDYGKVCREMTGVYEIAKERMIPVLWVTHKLLAQKQGNRFLRTGLHWRCLKIHPALGGAWDCDSQSMIDTLALARQMSVPVLIHTGEAEGCYPMCYDKVAGENPDVAFILAHSRPVDETIEMMTRHFNVWCDTAFTPLDDVIRLIDAGLEDRVMWGTDTPILKYYRPKEDVVADTKKRLASLERAVTRAVYKKLTFENAIRMFKIES